VHLCGHESGHAVRRRARLIGLMLRNLRPTSFRSFESPGRQSYETQRHKMAIHASMRLADELNPVIPMQTGVAEVPTLLDPMFAE